MTGQVSASASPANVVTALSDQPLGAAGPTSDGHATYSTGLSDLFGILIALKPVIVGYSYTPTGSRATTTVAGKAPVTYSWDQAQHLTGYTNGSTTASYTYDGDGLRMTETLNGTLTTTTWDQAQQLPLSQTTGNATIDYVYGPSGRILEQINPALAPIALIARGSGADNIGTATTVTAPLSAPAQPNDQIIIATGIVSGRAVQPVGAGWTQIGAATTYQAGGDSVYLYRRTATGGETAVSVSYPDTTTTNTSIKTLVALLYRNVDPVNPVDVAGALGSTTNNTSIPETVPAPSVTTTSTGNQLLLIEDAEGLSGASGTWSAPSMSTEVTANASPYNLVTAIADQPPLGAPGPTPTITASYSTGLASLLTAQIALRPAPAPVLYYHQDQLGTTRAITDNSGTLVATVNYDPYGQPVACTITRSSAPCSGYQSTYRLGYAGAYTDPESDLLYLVNRYYDPATGQFLTRDPLDALTQSAYGYVNNNPLNDSDPSGLAHSFRDLPSLDQIGGLDCEELLGYIKMAKEIIDNRNKEFRENWYGWKENTWDYQKHLFEYHQTQNILEAMLAEYEDRCGQESDVNLTKYWIAAFMPAHKLEHQGDPGWLRGASSGQESILGAVEDFVYAL